MRSFLFLLTVLCFSVLAPAQSASNQNFKMEYVTYAHSHIVLSFQNLTGPCPGTNGTTTQPSLEVRCRWGSGSRDTTLFFHAGEIRQVMLPSSGGSVTVQAKTVKSCNSNFNGPWISLALTALSIRESTPLPRPGRTTAPGYVRVVAINGSFQKEMTETEFQQLRSQYRIHYFIIRPNKPKEIIL